MKTKVNHLRMSPICQGYLASERIWSNGTMSCELQKLRLSASSPVAPMPALRPIILTARAVLEKLPQLKVECIVCGESVHPYSTVRLVCSDVYCKPCLKSFFLRVANDESLFPPKCHGQPIDISTIEADFSVEDLTAYQSAELGFTSTDRVYCADPECAKFIPMP